MSNKKLGSTRRDFLKVASAGSLLSCGPYIHAQPEPTLRILGSASTMQERMRLRAQEDLGITLEYSIGDTAQIIQKTLISPDSFDILNQSAYLTRILQQSNVTQAIDAKRLSHWDEVDPLYKTGYTLEGSTIGAGDAPHKINFLNPDGSFASEQTDSLSLVPHVCAPASFVYNADIIPPGVPYETESWSWLLDEENRGRVGLYNNPTNTIFDLALAAQAQGWMQFEDIGAMTGDEVDRLMEVILRLKSEGHFAGFWTTPASSVDFFRSGRVSIESMFASTFYMLRSEGLNARFAVPKEGYRAWPGGLIMSSRTEGRQKDMAYEYIDWWLSGWAGAYMAKSGYYISTPQLSRPWMSEAEWNYWYEGKSAVVDIKGIDDRVLIPTGDVRSGGSYQERMNNIAVWNTAMPTYDYVLQRWYELLMV